MQMKHLLVALLVLLALVGTAAAADSVEIRSTVVNYATIPTSATGLLIGPADWAGLYFNLDDNVSTENITLLIPSAANTPNKGDLHVNYTTIPAFQSYAYDGWADTANPYGFAIVGFFAEPYVALGNSNVSKWTGTLGTSGNQPAIKATKIAKLIIDDDTKYTLKTGATLELGEGYSIIVDQIDVDGNKAYLKLMKDGRELNSSIVNTNTTPSTTSSTWIFDLTVLGEKNMQVMRVHVKDVFQGTESSLVEIDGLWMVDYQNAKEIKSDDKFGKFECTAADNYRLTFLAEEITLSADSEIELGAGIYIKTEKNFAKTGLDKFYLFKEYTTPGTYEIRSSVFDYGLSTGGSIRLLSSTTPVTQLDFKTFAAFFYDMDTGIDTEVLKFGTATTATEIPDGNLTYSTTPKPVYYAYDWEYDVTATTTAPEYFFIMGLFGEKYVPFNIVNVSGHNDGLKADKMAKLVIDDDTKYTLKTGATLELGDGYTLVVDQIDVDGNKAYIRFMKDGQEVNSSIVNTKDDSNWILRSTLLNEKNVQIARFHVKDVFQGTQDSLVEIDGLWLMDYKTATELKTSDKFGVLEYDGVSTGTSTTTPNGIPYTPSTLSFSSSTKISWATDMDKQIANNMYLKTADNSSNKFAYFYVNAEVGEGSTTTEPPVVDTPQPPIVEPPVVTPPVVEDDNKTNTTPPIVEEPPIKEPSFLKKYMWHIIIAIVLIIIIAAVAYYFLVMKKQ